MTTHATRPADDPAVTYYVPRGPLDTRPQGFFDDDVRRAGLLGVLRGVELGAHDQRIVEWLLNYCDDGTLRSIASLIGRARDAAAGGDR